MHYAVGTNLIIPISGAQRRLSVICVRDWQFLSVIFWVIMRQSSGVPTWDFSKFDQRVIFLRSFKEFVTSSPTEKTINCPFTLKQTSNSPVNKLFMLILDLFFLFNSYKGSNHVKNSNNMNHNLWFETNCSNNSTSKVVSYDS